MNEQLGQDTQPTSLAEHQRQQRIYEAVMASTPDLIYVFDLNYRFTYVNQALLTMWGSSWEQSIGKSLLENGYQPWHAQMHEREIDQVVATRQPVRGEVSFPHATLGNRVYDYVFAPVFNEQGEVEAIAGTTRDVTDYRQSQELIRESEGRFRSLIEEAPVATMFLAGPEHVIDVANEAMLHLLGMDSSIVGQPVTSAIPELGTLEYVQPLNQVFTSGNAYEAKAIPVKLRLNRTFQLYYFDLMYKPVRNQNGELHGIITTAVNVTEQVVAYQQLAENEAHLKLLRNAVPAMIFYLDQQQRYQSYNDTFMHWFGVDATEALGKTVRDFLGEAAYQKALPHLTVAYAGQQEYYEVWSPSKMGNSRWLAITYTPDRTEEGQVLGLIVHAADITQNKQVELDLREREDALRNAVEVAQLGTWSIDVATNGLTYSDRLIEWFGYDPAAQEYEAVIPILEAADQKRVASAVAWALDPRSGGVYNEIYTIIHPLTGQRRVLHAQGKTVFDLAGKAVRLNGTAQDITMQQQLQLALEQQVLERTRELALANTELAAAMEEGEAINEELTAANEEMIWANQQLNESNHLLSRSNENLQQFAYIASHDLQEPLRKIQAFGNVLQSQFSAQLGEGADLIQRMQAAAERMSVLIRDLLAYSRIATQREADKPVSLAEVVNQVLTDLDMLREEMAASIEVNPLPTITGDASQLGQLFQNLISNALKFSRPGVAPAIRIQSTLIRDIHLPAGILPGRIAELYHHIDVIDNGIGFEQKYVHRIFQVFQRLHGRGQYAGTGIGLAICEKVVTNHGGAITASSQPGQGATFSLFLPA